MEVRMKRILSAFLALLLLAGLGTSAARAQAQAPLEEDQMKEAIRGFMSAWTKGDIKQASSYFAEGSVWVTPLGTFEGIGQIEKFANWIIQGTKDFTLTETGAGIIVQGNFAAIEHNISGVINGLPYTVPGCCFYEFKDGKFVSVKTFLDVLSQAQQITPDGPAKEGINAIVQATRQGL